MSKVIPIPVINRVAAIGYLTELHKTAGNKKYVLPKVFTDAVCDICDCSFVKVFNVWAVRISDKVMPQGMVEMRVIAFELSSNVQHGFCDIVAFVKWDLVHQKLKELNKAVA